jgi:hypothetical protein
VRVERLGKLKTFYGLLETSTLDFQACSDAFQPFRLPRTPYLTVHFLFLCFFKKDDIFSEL